MEQCVEAFAAADERCNAARVALSTDPLFILRQSPALTNLSTTREMISVLRQWLPAIIESNDTARSAVDSLIVSHERKREAFKWIVENAQSSGECPVLCGAGEEAQAGEAAQGHRHRGESRLPLDHARVSVSLLNGHVSTRSIITFAS